MPNNTQTLSNEALKVIDSYRHLKIGNAVAPTPYFNNKTVRGRASLRALIGKGNPTDIKEELEAFMVKHHINTGTLSDEILKKILVDNNIGVDCSAFAYHVLEAENRANGYGALNRRITFVHSHNPMSKVRSYLRPVENCDVSTIASERNSRSIGTSEIRPGDFISMIDESSSGERNHILIIHSVSYELGVPTRLMYSHTIRYPTDGLYESGVRQGEIILANIQLPITEQEWVEDGKTGTNNQILARAKTSHTELRRLKWL